MDSSDPVPSVRRLPVETLLAIFHLCLPQDPSSLPRAAPLLLCHVCHRWREVVLHTPSLWTTVWMHDQGKKLFSSTNQTILLEWIERSGGLPLDVILHDSRQDVRYPLSLLGVLVQTSRRWRSLHLSLGRLDMYDVTNLLKSFGLPKLQKLTLESSPTRTETLPDVEPWMRTIFFTSTIPVLSSITAAIPWGVYLVRTPGINTHMRQMNVTLALSGLFLSSCLQIFPNLEALDVTFTEDSKMSPEPAGEPLTIANLHSLNVDGWEGDVHNLITGLCLPYLSHLGVQIRGPSDYISAVHLSNLIKASNTPLRHLKVAGMSKWDALSCLQLTPHLQYLEGPFTELVGPNFNNLASNQGRTDHEGLICPTLEEITFSELPLDVDCVPILADIISARSQHHNRSDPQCGLAKVDFVDSEGVAGSVHERRVIRRLAEHKRLQCCIAAGFKLETRKLG